MRRPGIGESNLGALAGVVVGAFGGLFAVGIARAILGRDLALLFITPVLSMVSWVVCAVGGWVLGGKLGPIAGKVFKHQRAEVVAGALGGLVPVILIALWGWYMVRPR